jgi:hypothetical protein|tara:strand:+ start:4179 stop:4502 length:324 start_codon:yes stop_codon:yes gene_type:complete
MNNMENLTLIYLLIGSTALNLVTLYVIRNVLRKNEKQEDILVKYLNYLDSLSKTIAYIDEKLSKIDVKGTFESDDEIGWFFREIKGMQKGLTNFKLIDGEEKEEEEV